MKPRNLLIISLVCATAGVVWSQTASETRELQAMRARQSAFMRTKLAYSQGILEGLTLEKFELVSKNALQLRRMSEKGDWFQINNLEYKAATTNFYRQTDALFMAAAAGNLKSASDSYKNVIDSCVSCHAHFRGEQMKRR